MDTCERYIWQLGEERRCAQAVGLIRWHDETGRTHAACHAHVSAMTSLYPIAPTEIGVTWTSTWTDAGWTESELRESFGG